MDRDVDVALWQRGIQNGHDQELGPVYYLFEASVSAFSALLHILAADSSQFESESYQRLRNEFRKFYMWNEGFSTRTGDLDHILASSKNLKGTVLGLMVQWAKAASKIPEVMSEHNWSSAFTEVAELQMRADKVDQIAKATMLDLKSQCSVFGSLDAEDESDSGSDFESSLSDDTFEDIVEDLSIYMDSLTDLSSSLDHPATDNILIEDLNTSLAEEFANVPEPARPFVFIIRDRFPSLETGIVKRLGEANWQRRERLRVKFASAPGMDETSSTEDDSSSLEATIVDPRRNIVEDQQTIVSTIRTSISLTRTVQSTTIASDFSDPSIFDNMSTSVPLARRVRPPESVTSFATSMAEGLDQGQRRIPNLPEEHEYGSPFQCQICGDVQTGIRNRGDWKKHIYNDLEPYICLFTGCDLGLRTFQSRREWRNHEFQVHRVNIEWRCNLCKETFETQEVFRGHMIAVHENEITTSQVEEVMSTSKRLVPCTIATQLCPFCLTAPSEAQAGFASHVGKHQQEIALAALPRLGDTPDDEKTEYSESSDNDDDDDDPKAIPSAGDGEEKRAASEHHDQDLAKPQQQTKPVLSRQNSADYSRENSVEPSVTSPSLSQQDISRESHSVSQDAQQSINTTWGPQNRLMFTIRDFEKTINKCGDLWKLLPPEATSKPAFISLNKEMDQLREISELLASISLSLDQPIIEKSIEAFSICRTQLIRLQRLLDSTIYNVDEPDKKSRRPNVILKQLFTRQQTSQKPDISKAQDVLVGLLEGRQSLSNILNKVQLPQRDREHSESLSGAEAQLSPERLGPQMVLSPTGTLHINKHISSQRSSAERSLAQHATMSDAIRDGHLEYVTRYLDGGLDVNEKLGDHGPALTVAALSGQDAIVKLLLDRGANVNVISGNYGTALHAAASCLHESIITILLGNGADINIQAGEHGTVLQEAVMNARNQDDPTIILLIKRGADVNAVGGRYGTALQAAAVTGQLSTVKLLLTQGADVDAQGGEYGNALQAASAGGNLATVAQLIAAGANVNARGGKHYTALRAARHVEIGPSGKVSELLLNNGADPAISPENDGAAFTFPREASERKATLGPLRTSFLDDYQKYELFLNEETGPERKTGTEVDSTRPGSPSSVPEETSKNPFVHPIVRSDRVSIPEILKSQFSLDAYDPVDGTEVFEEDDVAYPCKGCGDIVEEGKAFELAGNRWHLNCFRCNTCGTLLDSDSNLLLLGDGSLICNNCTYNCSACGKKIEDLAILTGDQAFCAQCFRCRNCKRKIENLRYARTSQGLFCMSCHESLMARRRKKPLAATAAASSSLDKPLPSLPSLFSSRLGADVESGEVKKEIQAEFGNESVSPDLQQGIEK